MNEGPINIFSTKRQSIIEKEMEMAAADPLLFQKFLREKAEIAQAQRRAKQRLTQAEPGKQLPKAIEKSIRRMADQAKKGRFVWTGRNVANGGKKEEPVGVLHRAGGSVFGARSETPEGEAP